MGITPQKRLRASDLESITYPLRFEGWEVYSDE